jgi:hypothetical protein
MARYAELLKSAPGDYRPAGWIGFDLGASIEIPRIANAIGSEPHKAAP